ncbi:MAG: BrnA antitoxin family protein [Bryobacterales bacterium]
MTFVWDEAKARINQRKHGVSFETAVRVFEDPHAVSYPDAVVDDGHAGIRLAWRAASQSCWSFTRFRSSMAKKKSGSSRREKRVAASEIFATRISEKERRELERIARKPDSEIDYSDAPETELPPAQVEVGRFYRPVKQLISIRVDADVLAWFRSREKRYQTYMNEVLRREMRKKSQGGA